MTSANFEFLRAFDERLTALGGLAERYFQGDPSTSLIKLRQFAELTALIVAARHNVWREEETFEATLRRLSYERLIPSDIADIFHALRKIGNIAVHQAKGSHADALTALKLARNLGVWLRRTYGGAPEFKPGPFVPPPEPQDAAAPLREEIEDLRRKLLETEDAAARARREAEEQAVARESAEDRLARETQEREIWEKLAEESDAKRAALAQELTGLQAAAKAAPEQTAALVEKGEAAAKKLDLDEAETRALIDQQLRDRGWEADTKTLRHHLGVRPAKGKNMAVAEWPTAKGPADYALFAGKTLIGLIEAKRKNKNVSAFIDQTERYASAIKPGADFDFAEGAPWGEFFAPFLFSTNGRPYLKQLETASGIWFRDARKSTNLRRALTDWPTPQGLLERLQIDGEAAEAKLKAQPIQAGFGLRPYQRDAIQAVEAALASGKREMLVAMATGTGKTKLAMTMLYRLLEAKRFRRICFVVDRSALGEQTHSEFSTANLVSNKSFADIFGVKGLRDPAPDPETRLHICTIQSLVKRVLFAEDPSKAPPVDQYDLIVVDECHRGYLLDREMSDRELSFREEGDYISKYRRVLEHFDAVKIGLTATPALHTTEIFGAPIFRYSYREAVIDGWLIDHEPPIRIKTKLSEEGIAFAQGEAVKLFNPKTQKIDTAHAPDVLAFEVEHFNRQVITEAFNQTVAKALAKEIDPNLKGKTLVFAATDAHADLVVKALKEAFTERYGEIDDAAVRKLTGSVDKVQEQIRAFRNDANPKIAVTVDLLTTGIDIPKIVNLVFLRRVNSRILYEQMIGRATRLCTEIGKESFRIFDAVDLYRHIQHVTEMRPVVADPKIGFAQLVKEMGAAQEAGQQEEIRAQFLVKLRRRLRRMNEAQRQSYEAAAGETPEASLTHLEQSGPAGAAVWMKAHGGALGPLLDDWAADGETPLLIPISEHPDELISVKQTWGDSQRPEDYLESFAVFVKENVNTVAALKLAAQRPRDLTRKDLHALRLLLDQKGYPETHLRKAWSQAKNADIAASIIGHVRQAALGDPLLPYEERVKAAVSRILASRFWSVPQRQWLQNIGEQIVKEVVVDREAVDKEPFRSEGGGFKRLDKIFDGELETLLAEIGEEIWKKTGS